MFETLSPNAPDAILALIGKFKADPNPRKIDLGVGVYKAEDGSVPIMRAVKQAEARLLTDEMTKTYVGTVGNAEFRRSMLDLILGPDHTLLQNERIASAQTAGGSGALRLGAEMIKMVNPDAVIWAPTPTWANHIPLIGSTGLPLQNYPYYDPETLTVNFEGMCEFLKTQTKAGDVVLLHGCCHNPTGADLSDKQWESLAKLMADKNLLPFIDLAYFGLGRNMDDDTYGLRTVLDHNEEVVIAASCSKNFALYRERVGLVAISTKTPDLANTLQGHLGGIQRKIISMPPNHGAEIVATILQDEALRADWQGELTAMRERINGLRNQLSDALNVQGAEKAARAIRDQWGMFSQLPLSEAQAIALRRDHSVYITNSGRTNIAGLNADNLPRFAKAVLSVL